MKFLLVRGCALSYRRSREGAWIEMWHVWANEAASVAVAPARERGLKYAFYKGIDAGCRRSREGAWIEIKSLR